MCDECKSSCSSTPDLFFYQKMGKCIHLYRNVYLSVYLLHDFLCISLFLSVLFAPQLSPSVLLGGEACTAGEVSVRRQVNTSGSKQALRVHSSAAQGAAEQVASTPAALDVRRPFVGPNCNNCRDAAGAASSGPRPVRHICVDVHAPCAAVHEYGAVSRTETLLENCQKPPLRSSSPPLPAEVVHRFCCSENPFFHRFAVRKPLSLLSPLPNSTLYLPSFMYSA